MNIDDRIDRLARKQKALKEREIQDVSELNKQIFEHDYRIAMLESSEIPRRFMEYSVANTACLAQMQKELDNVIVSCQTLGDKSYELRTTYLPELELSIDAAVNELSTDADRLTKVVIGIAIIQFVLIVYLMVGWIYG